MFKASLIKLDQVSASTPEKIADGDLMISKLTYIGSKFMLKVNGTVASDATPPNASYNIPWRVELKPEAGDIPTLQDLETLLEDNPISQGYELVKHFGEDLRLKLKLKSRKNGWSFTTNSKDFDPSTLTTSTFVSVNVVPGFYFTPAQGDKPAKYGIFFTVDHLDVLNELPAATVAPAAIKKGRR